MWNKAVMSEDLCYGHCERWIGKDVGERDNSLFSIVHTTSLEKIKKTMKSLNSAVIQVGYLFEVSDIAF